MAKYFGFRACLGLFVIGCLIGVNVMDITAIQNIEWVIENEESCIPDGYNEDYQWISALKWMAYVEMAIAVVIYGAALLGGLPSLIIYGCGTICWYCLFFVGQGLYFTNYWFEYTPDCEEDEIRSKVYSLMVGATSLALALLPFWCCLCPLVATAM
eukprot:91758_1